MDVSAKMPAMQDATLAARMPSTMPSDAGKYAGEGGPSDPPVVPVSRDSSQKDPQWQNLEDKGAPWETADKKLGASDGWSAMDRKEGTEAPETTYDDSQE